MSKNAGHKDAKERNTIDLSLYSSRAGLLRTQNHSQKHRAGENSFYKGTHATEEHFNSGLASLANTPDSPVSIYLHLPFSPYQLLTDDTRNVANNGGQEVNDYLDVIEREIKQISERLGRDRPISQLHLGGSAPNSISQKHLVRIQDLLEQHFDIDSDTEMSLVADPSRTSFAQMDLLAGLGFKQISYGACDVDSQVQATLGRVQSSELIRESFQASREAGFEVITSDLLYGIPNQTVSGVQATVDRYLELKPDRIICRCYRDFTPRCSSTYSPVELPSLADKMAAFHTVVEGLTAHGYEWVGVDCFARGDDPLLSRNQRLRRNRIGYSTNAATDLLGFGTNTISEIGGVSVQKHAGISQWSDDVSLGNHGVARGIVVDDTTLRRRRAMEELICNGNTVDINSLIDDEAGAQQMRRYQKDGVVEISVDGAQITPNGQFLLSQLWDELLPSSLPQ